MRQNKQQHIAEVRSYLQHSFARSNWTFSLPGGSGNETYFAHNSEYSLFIKVGAHLERATALSQIGLTPPVLAAGQLEDGTSILVQHCVQGRKPTRKDYHDHLEQIAIAIRTMHHDFSVRKTLPHAQNHTYATAALAALADIRQRWGIYRLQVPDVAPFVDNSLHHLEAQVTHLQGSGLVASHNDLCNDNMLLTKDDQLYILDLEMMSLDDPSDDIGTLLWWYYPPHMRRCFLDIAGYADDPYFADRVQVRVPLHLLRITLPRLSSFDRLDPSSYSHALTDFRAAIRGQDNPEGHSN